MKITKDRTPATNKGLASLLLRGVQNGGICTKFVPR